MANLSSLDLLDVLGNDLQFPIDSNFAPVSGLDLLIQDIQLLLLTLPGEIVGNPQYGCILRALIWENIDTAATDGVAAITTALELFEPRITLIGVTFTLNRNTDLISYVVKFVVKTTDVAANLVFPFRTHNALSGG